MSNTTFPKLVFVTGAGRGIGRAIALRLIEEGFVVSGCARSTEQLGETRKLSGGKLKIAGLDVRSPEQVERWMSYELGQYGVTPWGLVTAAGIHGDIAPFTECDWSEWKLGVEVNLYGTALPCHFFAKHLIEKKAPGRIVMLSGGGATQPIENMTSYCASKSAVVRFGETLAHELKPFGITVNSVAPGAINTAITETILAAGPEKAGKSLYEKTLKQKNEGGSSPDKPAGLAAYLMSEASAPVTGKLISAVWDPWATLHTNAKVLENRDMYTLRRLVPEDQK